MTVRNPVGDEIIVFRRFKSILDTEDPGGYTWVARAKYPKTGEIYEGRSDYSPSRAIRRLARILRKVDKTMPPEPVE